MRKNRKFVDRSFHATKRLTIMKQATDHNSDSILNDEQRSAATYSGRNLLVLAGAGTGKTRTIIARARHLLESGVSRKSTLSQEISSTLLLKMLPYVKTFTRPFITLPSLVARRSASLVMRNMALVHQNTILCHSLAVAMERH